MKKLSLLLILSIALSGCATWDWNFNKAHERAQLYLDNYRYVQNRIDQGQIP